MKKNWFAAVCLLTQPIMLAGGYIALRKMKRNHTMVVACYVNLTLFVVSLLCVTFMKGIGFGFVTKLGWATWLLFVISALNTICDQTSKFIALKYIEASKL